MWELDHKESWALKNWCFWTVVLQKTLERPLDFKEIKPVSPKGNQPWIFIGRTDAEAETSILWPLYTKNWLIGKDSEVERLTAGGEGDDRGWDGWMASPTKWIWVWASSGSWWWIGRPGVLQAMGSLRVGHDWAIELNWCWMIYNLLKFLTNILLEHTGFVIASSYGIISLNYIPHNSHCCFNLLENSYLSLHATTCSDHTDICSDYIVLAIMLSHNLGS